MSKENTIHNFQKADFFNELKSIEVANSNLEVETNEELPPF